MTMPASPVVTLFLLVLKIKKSSKNTKTDYRYKNYNKKFKHLFLN